MKTRRKRISDMIASALLLLALIVPSAANGQSTDNFFYIDDGVYRSGDDIWTASWLGLGDNTVGTGSWLGFGENTEGEASWEDFEEGNPLPTGAGLLVMTLSGACYAGAKRRRSRK